MVGFIVSLVANQNNNGYEISAQKYNDQKGFFELSTRGGPACRAAISSARNKIHWKAFRFLFERLNEQTKDHPNFKLAFCVELKNGKLNSQYLC